MFYTYLKQTKLFFKIFSGRGNWLGKWLKFEQKLVYEMNRVCVKWGELSIRKGDENYDKKRQEIVLAEEIGWENQIILSKIGQGKEIILSKICRGNESAPQKLFFKI